MEPMVKLLIDKHCFMKFQVAKCEKINVFITLLSTYLTLLVLKKLTTRNFNRVVNNLMHLAFSYLLHFIGGGMHTNNPVTINTNRIHL